MSPKYEDDDGLSVADWDGTVRLGCTCGWKDSRIASPLIATTDRLAGAWRDHVTADMVGLDHRGLRA